MIIAAQKRAPSELSDRIAYIDLFAGPGRYRDGTKSTPLLVLEKAVQDQDLRQRLVTVFNDQDEDTSHSLDKAIRELPGIDNLVYEPKVQSEEVGSELVRMIEQMRLGPTLFFVDPWGYKGLSLELISSVLKDWGCDCIFFFNDNRINMGLGNELVQDHMNALFGKPRADRLRNRIEQLGSHMRELEVVEEICQALKDAGGKYVLPFCFKNDSGNRTSHHLIFISKNFTGYEIMKKIMARESSRDTQNVSTFQYSPAHARQPLLFELYRPLDDFEDKLLERFAGQTLTTEELYMVHNVDTPYVKKNYKDALIKLELAGRITAEPSINNRRKGIFADTVRFTFPLEGGQ